MRNRKIIFQVTAAYMRKNRKRTLITFAGILAMVVLMTAVFVGKDTAINYMCRMVEADKGSWHGQVYDVTGEQVEAIRTLDSVEEAEISRPLGYTDFPASGNPDTTPFLELKGYSGDLFDWMNIRVLEGRLPENDREILLSVRALHEGADVKVGDTLEINAFTRKMHVFWTERDEEAQAEGKDPGGIFFSSGFRIAHGETAEVPAHFPYYADNDSFEMIHEPNGFQETVTVVGIMEQPYYETKGQGGYMALTKINGDAAKGEVVNLVLKADLHSKEDFVDAIAGILDRGRTEEEREVILNGGMRRILPDGSTIPLEPGRIKTNELLLTLSAKGQDGGFNMIVTFFQIFFVTLITAASFVLIYNVFSISYRERCRYLGMLSSVGATRSQKRWSVYFEVFAFLLFALPLGIALGILTVKGGMSLLQPHFRTIMETIASAVIAGRNIEVLPRVIVRPSNILFVLAFSALAVWLSAQFPARKISRIGPVESIRGNDGEQGADRTSKGSRTKLRLMEKSWPELLLASAGIGRNRSSTRGIVRSITAFVVLTLVTAFASRSVTDLVKSKLSNDSFSLGSAYEEYDYVLCDSSEEEYLRGRDDIETSAETISSRELRYSVSDFNIPLDCFTDEYTDALETLLGKFFPEGVPEQITELYTKPLYTESNPSVNSLVVSEEDFARIARRAGADLAGIEVSGRLPVLVLDTVTMTTDDFRFDAEGSVRPDYYVREVGCPLALKVGDDLPLLSVRYDPETDFIEEIRTNAMFAGYVASDDLREYVSIRPDSVWLITSGKTMDRLKDLADATRGGLEEKYLFFSVRSDDSDLLRRLAQIKDLSGESCLQKASMMTGMTDFTGAVAKIIEILAFCFTILIAFICLLNLFNSVMGRRLARHRELAVLATVGITGGQRKRALALECAGLLLKSFAFSTGITAIFVVSLRRFLEERFGKMTFTLPLWMILTAAVVGAVSLFLFTAMSYRGKKDAELIEEVRAEAV